MNKTGVAIFLGLLLFVPARADVYITPSPAKAAGSPGSTTGWGFTVINDTTYWVTFTGSSFESQSNPLIGFGGNGYTDFIGANSGPAPEYAIVPGGTWQQTFDPVNGTGIGLFQIDISAAPGASNAGSLRLDFENWTGIPGQGGAFFSSESIRLPTQVDVSTVPEPDSRWLLAVLSCATAALHRRRTVSKAGVLTLKHRGACERLALARNVGGGDEMTGASIGGQK